MSSKSPFVFINSFIISYMIYFHTYIGASSPCALLCLSAKLPHCIDIQPRCGGRTCAKNIHIKPYVCTDVLHHRPIWNEQGLMETCRLTIHLGIEGKMKSALEAYCFMKVLVIEWAKGGIISGRYTAWLAVWMMQINGIISKPVAYTRSYSCLSKKVVVYSTPLN